MIDTLATVALFVLGAPVVIYLVLSGWYMANGDSDGGPRDRPPPSRFQRVVDISGFLVPPIVLVGIYLAGIAFAYSATTLTFYYPLLALAVGFVAWYCSFHALSRWYQRLSKSNSAAYTKQPGPSLTRDEAIATVRDHIRRHKIGYPADDLVAESFPLGWSVYAPVHVDASDAAAFSNLPVGRAAFLIGDSGRIEQTSSSEPPIAQRDRFIERERLIATRRGRWVRRLPPQ
ncbi:hypothetical protein [Mycobacterium asiaticum]|uniref:Uncharacterized protein n=1 Tax=Mycobacterium asiaticum TaxID=1790 RepID=A0A1A3N277_MYCAS|nr:hypothetical protein [Mycobacterium asiaticum]OBK15455.1 hypothetical protein A5636_05700 [Mycobacterium asiaticum]